MIKIPEGDPTQDITKLDRLSPNDHQESWSCSVNTVRKALPREARSDCQKISHLVQGVEAAMLRAMVGSLPDPTCLMLLQHDGLTSRVRLDPHALEAAILAATGIAVRIDEDPVSSAPEIAVSAPNRPDLTGTMESAA